MIRRFRPRVQRPKRPKHWARFYDAAIALGASTTTTVDILTPTTYSANTALSPTGVTMARCIVEATFCPILGGAFDVSGVGWMLYENDNDTPNIAVTTANLTAERVLAHGNWLANIAPSAGFVGASDYGYHFRIDTKQRVRLQDSEIRLAFTESGGVGWVGIISASILLVGDTT